MTDHDIRRARLRRLAAIHWMELQIGLDPYGVTVDLLGDGDEQKALAMLRAMWLVVQDEDCPATAGPGVPWAERMFGRRK